MRRRFDREYTGAAPQRWPPARRQRVAAVIDRTLHILLLILVALALPALAQESASQDPLAMFDPLVGKTWKGEGAAGEVGGKTDIITWERIMGGKAVQSTHSIDDGEYGGVTVFFYDPSEKTVLFHYFTTANFHSTGTVEQADNGDIVAVETIHGLDNLPEVRGRIVFIDGGWETRASYLKDGAWVEGDGFRYVEAPAENVVFRDGRQTPASDAGL
jgi:hypothetical protein